MPQITYSASITDTNSMFCHQFIAGPDFIEGLKGWKCLEVTDRLRITSHPELEVQQVKKGTSSITLVGHMFDTDDPSETNQQILEKLVLQFTDIDTLIESCAPYGGRWLIIAVKAEDKYLFNDALGLRQVFYTDATLSDSVWLVSQPGLAQKLFNLDFDSITRTFIDSPQFSGYPEYNWPAYGTPFPQLRHLLPNHYLDINTRVHYRFWPKRQIEPIKFDRAVEELARRIQNTVTAVVKRFDDVALGITAGLDSRLILAASKKWSDHIGYVTVQQDSMTDNHQDITVPHVLLGKLGLPHSIVHALPSMSAEFSDLFKENVFLAHDHYGPDAEALMNSYNRASVIITGSGAEVGRCPYRSRQSNSDITAERLAALDHKAESEYAISQFSGWLADINDTYNVPILDLFSWENGHGNWLAMTQLEFDIAWRETITPYNCRSILTTMLAVDEKQRSRPQYKLANTLIRKMWPEVLSEPINPSKRKSRSLLGYIKRAIRKSVSVFR